MISLSVFCWFGLFGLLSGVLLPAAALTAIPAVAVITTPVETTAPIPAAAIAGIPIVGRTMLTTRGVDAAKATIAEIAVTKTAAAIMVATGFSLPSIMEETAAAKPAAAHMAAKITAVEAAATKPAPRGSRRHRRAPTHHRTGMRWSP